MVLFMSDELIGKNLGGYEILGRIGQGGMATVYRARQTSMDRVVALKILPKHLMNDDTYIQRFEREVRIVAQLEHRNIVPVHDYGEDNGQPYIAMRYMTAGSVDDLIKQGALTQETILSIIKQIAPALDYAHSKNVLHRDLKPSNILMDDDGGAYITDFGIARILGTETKGATITTQGVVGTPSYMSPEQAQGHDLDGRSDIYSLGVMVFEMATARRPFENDTPYGIAVMQVTKPPPNPRNLNPQISSAFETVILKALKKMPDNRFQTAVEMALALEDAVNNPDKREETQPRPPKPSLEVTQPTPLTSLENTMPSPVRAMSTYPPPTSSGSSGASRPVSKQYTQPPARYQRRSKRRSNNFWLSIVIGGLIGCALLTGIVVVLGLVARDLLEEGDSDDNIGTPANTAIATLDPTSDAARQTMVGSAIDMTPLFTDETDTPLGVRPSATFEPNLNVNESSRITYFALRDGAYNIYLYDLLSGTETLITEGYSNASYPAVAPDGSRIAFQSNIDGDWDIYIYNLQTRTIAKLYDTDVDERIPTWSPDSEYIVFSSDTRRDDSYDLLRISSAGGAPETLYSDGNRNSHARYSPDGRMLVFTSGAPDDAVTWEIILFDLSSGEHVQLTDNAVRDASPSFSPDGSRIIYNTLGEGLSSIVSIAVDGSRERVTLYDGEGFEWGMHYSPDGNYILFHEEFPNSVITYIMQSDGSNVRDIGVNAFYPVWIP